MGLLLGEPELYALTHGMQEWYPHRLCAVLFIQSGLHGCAGLQRPKASSSPCFKFVRSLEKKGLITIVFIIYFQIPWNIVKDMTGKIWPTVDLSSSKDSCFWQIEPGKTYKIYLWILERCLASRTKLIHMEFYEMYEIKVSLFQNDFLIF